MTDPGIPSPEPIKEITEKLTNFIQWLAELIQTKNWVALLVVSVVIGWVFFRPESGLVLAFLKVEVPSWYARVFWLVVAASVLTAVGIAIKAAPRPLKLGAEEPGTRKAIKGLRSFSVEDAEIFAKLQRNQSIQDCLESIARPEFRFGILVGESGSGKTSFLQAGIVPCLSQPDAPLRAVYVKFSDRPPIPTICAALIAQLAIPGERVEQVEFLSLLAIAAEVAGKPFVLLFDQFEQFFVHHPRKDDRAPFIQALTQWYNSPTPLPVKILVSIRADLQYELNQLQQALGYRISPYEIFQLEKFEPEEATAVLRVLADSEQLGFDSRFVKDVIQTDLTGVDGKVSPVDVQILAEIVRKQRKAEQRQFTREAFQKLGGIEGLLNRYLENALASLKIQGHTSLYQTVLQVLLALTDYNRNLRANLLTLEELQKKLVGIATPREVITAVNWLASSDVRLITPVERQQQLGYELVHERIIPALLRLTGNELREVEKAKQLLERRTQEWMGNQRHSRYLLNWHELRLIRTYKTQLQLDRDSNRRAKEQLLQKSWKRVQILLWSLALVLLLALAGWLAWLSPPVQYRYATWRLTEISHNVRHWTRRDAVLALAKNTKWDQALAIANSMEQDPYNTAKALNDLASIAIILKDIPRAEAFLKQAQASANTILDTSSKAQALSAMAANYGILSDRETVITLLEEVQVLVKTRNNQDFDIQQVLNELVTSYDKLNDLETANVLLEKALAVAETLDVRNSDTLVSQQKAYALTEIALGYLNRNDLKTASDLLTQALELTTKVQATLNQADTLREIAIACSQLKNLQVANPILEKIRVIAETLSNEIKFDILVEIADSYNKLNDSKTALMILGQAHAAINNPTDTRTRNLSGVALVRLNPNLNIRIADSYRKLNDTKAADILLQQELASVRTEQTNYSKLEALIEIATSYGKFSDLSIASIGLKEVKTIAETIQDDFESYTYYSKADVFSTIAKSHIQLRSLDEAREVLQQAIDQIEEIQNANVRSEKLVEITQIWCLLAEEYLQQKQPQQARDILYRALEETETIQDFNGEAGNEKATALMKIVSVWVSLGNWQQVNHIVEQCASDDCRVFVRAEALTTAAEKRYPELVEEEEGAERFTWR
ncbi:nSTAND1 domain-containing NTPase [Leptothoe sp. PORK10 BA2]|uniref:nSTAND1 domain-containing NTPase n=1 Tax=Leptothoe sp. PORK10 BA2 TaxID=3110254 RepID=UPI002B1FD1C3|nr:NACHT domain-containing protein [Leptothoe sp. PORK10 BA2]MEA5466362.1 NACHT domain-containing protein [Leptothoe sp. PORK10 BA2]